MKRRMQPITNRAQLSLAELGRVFNQLLVLVILLAIASAERLHACQPLDAQQRWGDLTGTVVLDGHFPWRVNIQPVGAAPFPDDSLIVDAKTKGIKNFVIFLRERRTEPVPVHPSYDEPGATLDKVDVVLTTQFSPNTILMRTSQTLSISNIDGRQHEVSTAPFANPGEKIAIEPGKSGELQFTVPESVLFPIESKRQPWARGVVVLQSHPYMATTDEQGKFTIKNLPVGKWTFQLGHLLRQSFPQVKVNGVATYWPKGRIDVEIHEGDNSFGTIAIPADLLKVRP